MVTNTLCMSFQRLGIMGKYTNLARFCSTNTSRVVHNGVTVLYKTKIDTDRSIYEPNFRLASIHYPILDLNLPQRPAAIGQINEYPIKGNSLIGEPPQIRQSQEDMSNERSLELPSNEKIIEKHAVKMIVIRRRKMRRHKLRKLRKRMKFVWGKIRQRREMKKEKAFHAELLGKIKKAEQFDPQAYVAKQLAILDRVRLPTKYRGEVLPEAQIREFLRRDEERKNARRNKPRLTL